MARGKHAARAANRKAQLDSEIVQEMKAEIEELKAQRDRARLEKQAVERRIYADAQRIGNRLAAESVEAMRKKLEDGEQAATAEMRRVGEDLMEFCAKYDSFPLGDEFATLMSRLNVDNFNEVFDAAAKLHGADHAWGRGQRRVRTRDQGAIREYRKQALGKDDTKSSLQQRMAEKFGGRDE